MIGTDFASYIRERLDVNSTNFTSTEIALKANIIKDDLALWIVSKGEDWFEMVSTVSLVANQREYPLPDDALPIVKMVEAKLDGTNWRRLTELDLTNYKPSINYDWYANGNVLGWSGRTHSSAFSTTDETTITENFSDEYPMYDFARRSIYILSGSAIDAVTDGLKLRYYPYPASITTTQLDSGSTDLSIDPSTTTFAMPRFYHRLWADMIILEYKEDNNRPLSNSDQITLQIKQELNKLILNPTQRNKDRVIIPSIPDVTI